MSAENTTKVKLDPDHPPRGRTDWKRVDALTDSEAHGNALADPDNPPLTTQELRRLTRVPDVKAIRQKLDLTQQEFAATFHLSLATVRDWEQARTRPDLATQTLLRVIEKDPEAVKRALETA